MPAGKLYIVATPIGNLKDITHRAVETLKGVDLIACEDTRVSRRLLDEYGIEKPLTSLFQGNEAQKAASVVDRLAEGKNVAFISEAGTPNISDPGYRLVAACVAKGIDVVPIPGPTAVISALSASGLPTDSFIFEGFLPPKQGARVRKMKEWEGEKRTVIFYESPHRIEKSLRDLAGVFGNIRVVIARELTKKFEEIVRLPAEEAAERFAGEKARGEFVVLFNLRMQNEKE